MVQNDIAISPEFIAKWKYELELHDYGSIKDPCDNFFEIDTSNILSDGVIRPRKLIATFCGFLQPQRVILHYQPEYNQYDIRIIDNAGINMLYLGLHYLINQNTIKLSDPTHQDNNSRLICFLHQERVFLDNMLQYKQSDIVVLDNKGNDIPYLRFYYPINHHEVQIDDLSQQLNPQFVSLIRKNGKTCMPIGFAMRHMNLQPFLDEIQTNAEEDNEHQKTEQEEDYNQYPM